MKIAPFKIDIATARLEDLRGRVQRARLPTEDDGADWSNGTPLVAARRLVDYWRDKFDWRDAERRLNKIPQFIAECGGQSIHFLHVKGHDPYSPALLLTHGWPGSFAEMIGIIPLLTHPAKNGIENVGSFDVIVPSLPGFGFSPPAIGPGMNTRVVAGLWHELMVGLGYPRYFAQGGDIGSGVTTWLARQQPEALRGIHLNFIPGSLQPDLGPSSTPLSDDERRWLKERESWVAAEGGYLHLQGTKPQTLAYALSDSPVGLAAWLVEKFHGWSDCQGNVFSRFSEDELLTNISLYWFSESVASTLRMYKENRLSPLILNPGERISVPTAYASFPKEIVPPPREWVERSYDLTRWTKMPRGGHFAALEEPVLLARDIHAAFGDLRMGRLSTN